jgi:hypothetical protein
MDRTSTQTEISPEAAAHVAALGMQAEFDQMVAHAWQTLPGLSRIHVTLEPPYDTGDEPGVVLWAYLTIPWQQSVRVAEEYIRWEVTTFPPDVCRHFSLLTVPGDSSDGR